MESMTGRSSLADKTLAFIAQTIQRLRLQKNVSMWVDCNRAKVSNVKAVYVLGMALVWNWALVRCYGRNEFCGLPGLRRCYNVAQCVDRRTDKITYQEWQWGLSDKARREPRKGRPVNVSRQSHEEIAVILPPKVQHTAERKPE
jgi:hypothetical protein